MAEKEQDEKKVQDENKAQDGQQNVGQLRHSLRTAIAGLLFLVIVASGTTYAWFTLSGRASTYVTPVGGPISEGTTSLLISQNVAGPFDKTCDLVYAGNIDSLKPLSTADLTHFYKVTAQNKAGVAVLYGSADGNVDTQAVHGTVYLQCLNAPCDVYFNRDLLKLGTDAQALAAMRLGMKITAREGTKTYIFRLDELGATGGAQSTLTVPTASTVVSSINGSGQAEYVNDPSVGLSAYMANAGNGDNDFQAGTSRLVRLEKDEVATVEYWIYLEGCDEQCINAVQGISSDIQLAFAGVSIE